MFNAKKRATEFLNKVEKNIEGKAREIDTCYLVSDTAWKDFIKSVGDDIRRLQEKGLEVEVQYKPVVNDNEVVYTALILGRIKQ
ncbi:hypothetical protein EQY69_07380 [Clostridium perfringens]|nr:hypothetical protein [Clostridium perfringens]